MNCLLAPGRAGLVDLEIQMFGDSDERVLVRRMQPAAADVESDVGRRHDGVAAAANAVARFQHDEGEAGILQRVGRTEARGAGADDGDIDFGGKGHGLFTVVIPDAPLGAGPESILPIVVMDSGLVASRRPGMTINIERTWLANSSLTPPLPWPFPRACGRWRRGISCAAGSTSGSPRPARRPRYRPAPFPGSS